MRFLRSLTSLATSTFAGGDDAENSCYMASAEELFDTPLSSAANEFLTACNSEFNEKQKRLTEQWLDDCERYDLDFGRGILRITRQSGPPVLFDSALVGSHDSDRGSWEWAWNNPNANPALAVPRSALAPIGEKFNLRYLLAGFVPVPGDDFPWYLCGIALKATSALGVYLATDAHMEYYLLLRNPTEGSG